MMEGVKMTDASQSRKDIIESLRELLSQKDVLDITDDFVNKIEEEIETYIRKKGELDDEIRIFQGEKESNQVVTMEGINSKTAYLRMLYRQLETIRMGFEAVLIKEQESDSVNRERRIKDSKAKIRDFTDKTFADQERYGLVPQGTTADSIVGRTYLADETDSRGRTDRRNDSSAVKFNHEI